jgi:hypothetical protein
MCFQDVLIARRSEVIFHNFKTPLAGAFQWLPRNPKRIAFMGSADPNNPLFFGLDKTVDSTKFFWEVLAAGNFSFNFRDHLNLVTREIWLSAGPAVTLMLAEIVLKEEVDEQLYKNI